MGVEGSGALARYLRLCARHIAAFSAAVSFLAAGSVVAHAVDASTPTQAPSSDAVNHALLKKIEDLKNGINWGKARNKRQSPAADTTATPKTQGKSGKRDDAPAGST